MAFVFKNLQESHDRIMSILRGETTKAKFDPMVVYKKPATYCVAVVTWDISAHNFIRDCIAEKYHIQKVEFDNVVPIKEDTFRLQRTKDIEYVHQFNTFSELRKFLNELDNDLDESIRLNDDEYWCNRLKLYEFADIFIYEVDVAEYE